MHEPDPQKVADLLDQYKELLALPHKIDGWYRIVEALPWVMITGYKVTEPGSYDLEHINFLINRKYIYTLTI